MGYTIGLPPGIYAPDTDEVRQVVAKVKAQNGVILPSSLPQSSAFATRQPRKRVLVTNLPLEIASEEIKELLVTNLMRKKLITSEDAVVDCYINASRFNATVTMKTQKDAEAAVQLGSLTSGQQLMKIIWAAQAAAPVEQDIPDAIDTSNFIFVDSILPLPSAASIKEQFEGCEFAVREIQQPTGFSHCIVILDDQSQAEYAAASMNGAVVDGVRLRVQRLGSRERKPLTQKETTKTQNSIGPSNKYAVVSPQLRTKPCVADILDCDVPVTIQIRPETERLQPSTGTVLNIFNVAPMLATFDQDVCQEIVDNMRDECERFGNVVSCTIERLGSEPLPCDYAVVRVTFESLEDAKKAQLGISGRRYGGRTVITQLVS